MVQRKGLILLVNVALVAVLMVILFWENDEDAIRARINTLARTVSRQGTEPILAVAGRVLEMESLFSENVIINVGRPVRQVDSRARLMDFFKAAWPRMGKITLDFKNIEIDISSDSTRATASATAHAVWSTSGGEVQNDERKVIFELLVQDGGWLISKIENPDISTTR